MKKLEYAVRFITPAFLGNAFQKGQWRIPPFKALLRQWWRVVEAQKHSYNHKELRETEGRLFGHAWLTYEEKDDRKKHWAMQSKLKIYLSTWTAKKLHFLPKVRYVCHPEVDLSRNKNKEQFYCKEHKKYHLIDPLLYLGYGSILGKQISDPISVDDEVSWKIVARSINNEVRSAIKLIQIFGTIGGRSRNGWGSLVLEGQNGASLPEVSEMLDVSNKKSRQWIYKYARDWKEALDLDWCHAIGKDETGLLFWRSKGDFSSWQEAMRYLAEVKIVLRTKFDFPLKKEKFHHNLCKRHILAYPVTNHFLDVWEFKEEGEKTIKESARLANQIIFKVHRLRERYVPIVVHLPHGTPEVLRKRLRPEDEGSIGGIEEEVWKDVHTLLGRRMQRLA